MAWPVEDLPCTSGNLSSVSVIHLKVGEGRLLRDGL